ncbi:MAG: alpha-2-macroglobulin family protein [Pseudomonadota bacterium]
MSLPFFKPTALLVLAGLLLPATGVESHAQQTERRVVVTQDSDYFGNDYRILKDVTVDACTAACAGDRQCKAFTYNVSAGWCFLKEAVGEFRAVEGAISGRVVETALGQPPARETRKAELDFLGTDLLDAAEAQAARVRQTRPAAGTLTDWLNVGSEKRAANDLKASADAYRQALRQDPERFPSWSLYADTLVSWKPNNWQEQRRVRDEAVSAAVNAYLVATSPEQRAFALATIGRALGNRNSWKPAIRSYRASLALQEVAAVREAYDRAVAAHGFRLVEHRIDSDAASPQICLVLSDDLALGDARPEDFVKVVPDAGLAVEAGRRNICIDGVRHGERYAVTLRAGLAAADGEMIEKTAALDLFIRDRKASVRFPGNAYVLPGHDGATIPVVTVNASQVEAELLRIGDRSLAATIGNGRFLRQLNQYDGEEIETKTGEKVWSGTVDVERILNEEVVSAIPVREIAPDLKPGAYALIARASSDARPWEAKATQWFVVTDLGLSVFAADDGFHVAARSLTTAEPLPDLDLRLVAGNNEILGTAKTGADGTARFDPGLARGTGGAAPALLVAENAAGDYAFLDLKASGLDLTDRGVDGREAPGPVDVFLTTERGIYRPGETVFATALTRDSRSEAIADLPLTVMIFRPDGKESERRLIPQQAAGGSLTQIALDRSAMRGAWRIGIYADPKGKALAETSFLVEDFLPERLDFELTAEAPVFSRGEALPVTVAARFLYGAPASGLEVFGNTTLTPVRTRAAYPGYVFGLAEEAATPVSDVFQSTRTDEAGSASLTVGLPASPVATLPLQARIAAQVSDTSGRPVERTLELPVADDGPRLGLKPLFEGAAGQNSTVQFDAVAIDPNGGRIAAAETAWTLSKIETDYQWYRTDGRWSYEPIYRKRRVASGTVDIGADEPVTLDAAVEWGGYELMLEPSTAGMAPVSHRFEAGWYVERKSLESPEALKVALDKSEYRIGETAAVQITPPFAGKARIMVAGERVIEVRHVDVPEDGATISLDVTEDWGAGAYVTALVYRPMDLGNKRMPARAVGLAWAAVDPADKRLAVSIEADEVVRPRQTTNVRLAVANARPGDKAYVTLAAVDAGILNLTGFETPDPEAHYFGQRRLGVDIKDVYNKLIDRMIGTPGRVRSGGDASMMRFEGPPPPDVLMAFHSGIEEVGPDGTVSIEVPIADFSGTVRLMAIAWSSAGIGKAERDIIARDPVVMTASMPRFLAPGDRSRVLVDVADVEGVGGGARLTVSAEGTALRVDPAAADRTLELADGGRQSVLVPVDAGTVGDGTVRLTLSLADGTQFEKTIPLGVRDNEPPVTRTSEVRLAPGQTVSLDPDVVSGLRSGTGTVTVSASGAGRLDVAGIVRSLDQYPYGCSEQLTSRALPLLYVDEVILAAGLAGQESVRDRVQKAIASVLANQTSSGGFGLWSPGAADLWVEAYVTDFLSRARDRGYVVPDQAFRLALDNLKNRLAYIQDFERGGEAIAYAFYLLARHGQAAISDLRYYATAKLEAFATPLAKAQMGAALALYGDQTRAAQVFRVAVSELQQPVERRGWRADYGSRLRDRAAILTLAAESGLPSVDASLMATDLDDAWRGQSAHSTQEEAWALMAVHALTQGRAKPALSVNGTPHDGPLFQRFGLDALGQGVAIGNRGSEPIDIAVTARGAPLQPEPAGGTFASITRGYFALDGTPVDLAAIGQGERFVSVVTVIFNDEQKGQIIVDDPLPAGFEIDNPSLLRSGDVAALDWLKPTANVKHREFRADRFIASIDRNETNQARVVLAYVVRAVSPGRFAHPAAIVQDMYRMERVARTGSGFVDVIGPLR